MHLFFPTCFLLGWQYSGSEKQPTYQIAHVGENPPKNILLCHLQVEGERSQTSPGHLLRGSQSSARGISVESQARWGMCSLQDPSRPCCMLACTMDTTICHLPWVSWPARMHRQPSSDLGARPGGWGVKGSLVFQRATP